MRMNKVTNFDKVFDKFVQVSSWILIVGFMTLFWIYFYRLFIR